MASDNDAHGSDPGPTDQEAIVVHSQVHGEVAEWQPAPAPARPLVFRTQADEVILPGEGQSPPPPELAVPAGSGRRAASLDALRGLFLILMTLGFTVGVEKYYPRWMFHFQEPWGAETPLDQAGISWRDLAYASFLFTMAAALPLTMSRKIEKGALEIDILKAALRRFAMLLVYAIIIGHSNTFFLGYTSTARLISIGGFILMAMIFTRRRADWDERRFRMVNMAGWVLAIAFLALTPLAYGKTFSFDRNDDIIVGLAFASFFGIILWYLTRENLLARVAALAVAMALYLGAKGDGWVASWWWDSRLPWLFSPSRFDLFAVVVPGTIVGDLILKWMRSPECDNAWSNLRLGGLALVSLAFTPIVVFGMYNRLVGLTTMVCAALIAGGLFLVWDPKSPVERLLKSLYVWAAFWLMMGLFLEPFENGIHKVPDTLSYFFTITGTTSMLLVSLTTIIDAMRKPKTMSLLVDVGHNPLLLYVTFTVFLNPLVELVPGGAAFLRANFGEAMLRSVVELALVVVFVRAMSRKRIYWRT
jgi:predicted acyltransferase